MLLPKLDLNIVIFSTSKIFKPQSRNECRSWDNLPSVVLSERLHDALSVNWVCLPIIDFQDKVGGQECVGKKRCHSTYHCHVTRPPSDTELDRKGEGIKVAYPPCESAAAFGHTFQRQK